MTTESIYIVMLGIQFLHSIEELSHNFHEKFPLFKMSFRFFLTFEIIFFSFWLAVILFQQFPLRSHLINIFILLMFVNGLWHLVWWGVIKKYVPGLMTAPFFIITFLIYYFHKFL